jgi:hypothetical protein
MAPPRQDPASIYDDHIASLPDDVKLRLVALIAERVASREPRRVVRLADLDGLGREVWAHVDPDDHVRRLRDEWDGR